MKKYTIPFPCNSTRFPLEGQMLGTNFAIVFCVGFGWVVDASVYAAMKHDTRRHCHVTNRPKHFCLVALRTGVMHVRTVRRKGNAAEFPELQRPDISLHLLTIEMGQSQYLQPQNCSVAHTIGSFYRSLPNLCFLESSASSFALRDAYLKGNACADNWFGGKGFIMTRGDGSCVDNSFLLLVPRT